MPASDPARSPICPRRSLFAVSTAKPVTVNPAEMSRRAKTSPMRPRPTSPTGWVLTMVLVERGDGEIARHRVETFAQAFRHRHAVRAAVQKLGVALLARQPDALDAGQALRIADIADHLVDGALEIGGWHECLDRYRCNRLAGIGRLAGLLDEVDHLATERGAVERAGEQPNNEA